MTSRNKIERIWLADMGISGFNWGILGGILIILVSKSNLFEFISFSDFLYSIITLSIKPLLTKIAKMNKEKLLTYSLIFNSINVVLETIFYLIGIFYDPTIMLLYIIYSGATNSLRNINMASYEHMRTFYFKDAEDRNVFKVKMDHIETLTGGIGGAINMGLILIAKKGIINIDKLYIVMVIIYLLLNILDLFVSYIEYKQVKKDYEYYNMEVVKEWMN